MPIYMKYEGVDGEVTGKYKGWIELKSCQLGMSRHVTSATGQSANREANAPAVSEIVITKDQDSASGSLFRESMWGQGKKVTIVFVRDKDPTPYLTIELEGVLVSSYTVNGRGGDPNRPPMESLSLNFTKITYKTHAMSDKPDAGKDSAMWQTVTPSGS